MQLEAKYEKLKIILLGYGRVAVAFSGGTDSSLLLKCALDTLGTDNVLMVFTQSELLTPAEIDHVMQWPQANGYARTIKLENIGLQPLEWEEFVNNGKDRCYFCKRTMYAAFRERMEQRNFTWLIDGTNADDLKEHRAGLRAIRELGVATPFVEADLDKAAIRLLSQRLGLTTWDRPSSSCLATRIPTGMRITRERLQWVTVLEHGMERFGLVGCRVRLCACREDEAHLELRSQDFARLAEPDIRAALLSFFQRHGVSKVLVFLKGRA
jgi:TIGR00268 family protein